MKPTIVLAALILLFSACDSGKTGDSGSTPSATAAAQLPSSDTEVDKADVPVEEDFEGEAQKSITEDNLDDEVAKLTKEIEEDKE